MKIANLLIDKAKNGIKQNKLISIAFFIRLAFLIFGEIHDKFYQVHYTDIDYKVYTEGAYYLSIGKSPYDRHTYRYTPMLAILMLPNVYLFQSFGKVLFILLFITFDTLTGIMIQKLLRKCTNTTDKQQSLLLCLWLFNPLVFVVSSRGNTDTLLCLLTLICLYYILQRKIILSGIIFGFMVHFKIYPIIYSLPIVFYLKTYRERFLFFITSASTFFLLTGIFYIWFGNQFIYETYLYHLIRKDNRHNFSIYFYYIYLNYSNISFLSSMLSFVPQAILLLTITVKCFKDLPFCLFLQTFVFVLFNKVCTAQYFVWYMVFFPLIFAKNEMFLEPGKKKLIAIFIGWIAVEVLWGVGAYQLENLGNSIFLEIWIVCLVFFAYNLFMVVLIIINQKFELFEFKKKDKAKVKAK